MQKNLLVVLLQNKFVFYPTLSGRYKIQYSDVRYVFLLQEKKELFKGTTSQPLPSHKYIKVIGCERCKSAEQCRPFASKIVLLSIVSAKPDIVPTKY